MVRTARGDGGRHDLADAPARRGERCRFPARQADQSRRIGHLHHGEVAATGEPGGHLLACRTGRHDGHMLESRGKRAPQPCRLSPSATGTDSTCASGRTLRTPSPTASATCAAVSDPLNLSEAIRTVGIGNVSVE